MAHTQVELDEDDKRVMLGTKLDQTRLEDGQFDRMVIAQQ